MSLSFAAPVYLSAEKEAVSLLSVAPQRELALLEVFNGLEVRPARRLDGINKLRGPGAGQKWGRDGETAVLLHYIAARAYRTLPEWIQARATRCHLEELKTLVPGATSDIRGASCLLYRWVKGGWWKRAPRKKRKEWYWGRRWKGQRVEGHAYRWLNTWRLGRRGKMSEVRLIAWKSTHRSNLAKP